MEQTSTTTSAAGTRPVFLTVLCILSFIAAGLAIFGYIGVLTVMGAAQAGVNALENAAGTEGLSNVIESAGPSMGMTWAYLIIGFLCTLVGLFGVIKMWKLQKIGFFIYTGCSVVSMIMGIVYSGFSVMAVIFPLLFIVLYGLNLKHLK